MRWYRLSVDLSQSNTVGHKTTLQKILEHIDRNSSEGLNYKALRNKLQEGGNYWELAEVDPRGLTVQDADTLPVRTEGEPSNVPIVIDENNWVIDGRHRTQRALSEEQSSMLAWKPYRA